ncbi:B12-binding domain-containing radical SAM protein [Pseudoalteromonas maricaloris]|uniref:B12-binding domain-containing radical SAM protein n=1 Tax=Pseudoalteromonas maricaloris TaxID=184924 RepID=UPI003C23C754
MEKIIEVKTHSPVINSFEKGLSCQSLESISDSLYKNLLHFMNPQVAKVTKTIFIEYINDPIKSQRKLNELLSNYSLSCWVVGSILSRALIIIDYNEQKNNAIFVTTDQNLTDLDEHLSSLYGKLNFLIENSSSPYSRGQVSSFFIQNFKQIKVSLIGLYRTEIFPVPRVALGISCIARSLRDDYLSEVFLHDMQLGGNVASYVNKIVGEQPQIIGVSVTFGQQDILEQFLDGVAASSKVGDPLIVIGGSLAAFNKEVLLKTYSDVVIAHSSGEVTMTSLVRYKQGILPLSEVPGIAYSSNGIVCETKSIQNKEQEKIIPELDLLTPTLSSNGVMQLESSRGCTFACSFCPRDHKGLWFGNNPMFLEKLMLYISESYKAYVNIPKKIFLVDEEFIGYTKSSPQRALSISSTLEKYGFKFETSARADQVYSTKHNEDWHIDRISFWKKLKSTALSRCLFGIESGVDSILSRFNKKTTSQQNAYAIRLLSCTGIPTRFTYITFDNLMNIEELIESYKFLGRRDLLLKSNKHLSSKEIYSIATDETLAAANSTDNPFYYEVSYMLVKMENLVNSKYTKKVTELGLTRSTNKSMGTITADYVDNVIGELAEMSQRWIDRHFAFDYSLKGVQKISDVESREAINSIRVILRRFSYELLGQFIYMYTGDYELLPDTSSESQLQRVKKYYKEAPFNKVGQAQIRETCYAIMDAHMLELQREVSENIDFVLARLLETQKLAINEALSNWQSSSDWDLING